MATEKAKPGIRTESGRFAPGHSGNLFGRPRSSVHARAACRELNEETLQKLTDLMRNAKDEKVQAMCAIRIRDEANGKPCSVNDMPRDDEDSSESSALTDAELLQEAIARAKAIGSGN